MMKRILFSVSASVFAIFVLTGCKDKDENHYSLITSITAEVKQEYAYMVCAFVGYTEDFENWLSEIIAECRYEVGGFKLDLPSSLNISLLYPIYNEDEVIPDWLRVSDKTVLASTSLLLVGSNGKDFVGRFYREKEYKEGDRYYQKYSYAEAIYLYVNKDLSEKGSFSQDSVYKSGGLSYKVQIKQIADVSYKKGWNILYSQGDALLNKRGNNVTGTITVKMSTQDPGDLKWYFKRENFPNLSQKSTTKDFPEIFSINKSETVEKIKTKALWNNDYEP